MKNTLAILTAAAATLIVACDGSSSSEQITLAEDTEISSSVSDTATSSSSEKSPEISSSSTISSSSQETSSSEAISSSEAVSSSEALSSSEISSSDSAPKIVKLEALPFDTTGIKPDTLHYTHLLDEDFDEIDLRYYKREFGENLENYIFVTEGDGHYCHVGTGSAGGLGDYQNVYTVQLPSDCILMVHEDSLLFTNIGNCTALNWDSCRTHDAEYAYTQKIMVGDDTFYYGEFEKILLLVQVTDSTITNWEKKKSSYTPPAPKKFEWNKSNFEGDTLVTFISDDTIYIEKYNLKITDNEDTWIFGDEICTTLGYKRDAGMTDEESCYAGAKYHNAAIECRQRNLGITSPRIFPSICRPHTLQDPYLWCILDEPLESQPTF